MKNVEKVTTEETRMRREERPLRMRKTRPLTHNPFREFFRTDAGQRVRYKAKWRT